MMTKRYAGLALNLMLLTLLFALTGCFTPQVVVLPDSETIALKKGQPAPNDGFLIAPASMYELLKRCP